MRILLKNSIIVLIFISLPVGQLFSQQKREMQFEQLKSQLNNPNASFRSAPLWVWNTKVTYADIDRMLGELKEQGFGGAFVHPRPGLITEYLSDEWFDLYRYSIEAGKKLGLDIWIYDENSYPSGFAGGFVPEQMPESYNQGTGLVLNKVNILPENVKDYYLCLAKIDGSFRDITSDLQNFIGVEGGYYLYSKSYQGKSSWYGGHSYVDLLYPGVTEKFMEITMGAYEKHLGDKLGTEIKGIFTDEPQIASSGGIRWTPDFFDVFEKQWGYDLKSVLPLLWEMDGEWKMVRHNYMETLTQLFIDRWAKPWFEYTEKKGMVWTGHYWEHGWPDMSHGGDNMAMYAWHQMPGIDMLFNQFNDSHPQAQFGNVRSVKEMSSVANQMGYVRTLSETYGGAGWDVTFKDLKRLGDWEYVLGVNFMNQHLSHMTLTGARKYDYPPEFNSISPWWSSYKWQNDYFARLSMLLSQGEQLNDILILEPNTTIWLYYSYVAGHPKVMEVGSNFQNFVTLLEKNQGEYDLGSENIIKDNGKVENGSFVVGKRGYKRVVIPPMTENLNLATFELLKGFVASGGELILFSKPTLVDGVESSELKSLLNGNSASIKYYPEESVNVAIRESLQNDIISFSDIEGNDLYHHRRSYEDGELLFFVNSSLNETAKCRVSVKGKSLIKIDGNKGDLFAHEFEKDGEYVETDINLAPSESLILFSSITESENIIPEPVMVKNSELPAASKLKVNRVKDNVLNIDFCSVTVDGVALRNSFGDKNLYTVEACNQLYGKFGTNNPWNHAIQFRQDIVERDTFSYGNIKVNYEFVVVGDFNMDNLKLVSEQPGLWSVKINGNDVNANKDEYWLDAHFGVYEIGKHVRAGANVVELSLPKMSIYAEISNVYILGDFELQSASRGWLLKAPGRELELGSWRKQGIPFYSWDISYSKNYKIKDTKSRYLLELKKWNGTVADVFVNDNKVGIIAYEPYNFDLTDYLKKGDNKIEVRVVGSLKNLLGPHYSNEKGIAGPAHWNAVHRQDRGDEYSMIDYGLMEDFVVYKN